MSHTLIKTTALMLRYGNKSYRVGDFTHVGYLVGESGAGKSLISESIISAALSNKVTNNWDLNIGDKVVLHVDTEQPEDIAEEMMDRIKESSGEGVFNKRYRYANLTSIPEPNLKTEELTDLIKSTPNLGLVVCDNLSDLLPDINDQLTSNKFASNMASNAVNYGPIIIFLGHTNNENTIKGAAGKRIKEKSSFGFHLTLHRDMGITIVEGDKSRYGWIPSTDFTVNQETKELIMGPYLPFPTK